MADHDCYIYHATEEPRIVKKSKAEELYKDGWADSPAKFAKIEDFGADPENPLEVQQAGEAIEGVAEALNGALNIDIMTKAELVSYAKKHHSVELDMGKNKPILVAEVRQLINPEETLN